MIIKYIKKQIIKIKKKYEPECFPGFICEVLEEKVTILIFHTGKIVLTGAKVILNKKFKKFINCLIFFFKSKPDENKNLEFRGHKYNLIKNTVIFERFL